MQPSSNIFFYFMTDVIKNKHKNHLKLIIKKNLKLGSIYEIENGSRAFMSWQSAQEILGEYERGMQQIDLSCSCLATSRKTLKQ